MGERVVVVSGGSRGLGLSLVEHFLEAGDVVATCSRTPSPAILELQNGPSYGERLVFESADIGDKEAVRSFVANVVKRFQRVDVLINNAAVVHDGLLATIARDQIEQMVDINIKGVLFLTRECVRAMLLQSSGRVINVASIVGLRGYSGLVTYASTKAALFGLTSSLAREVGSVGITVNAVAPGYLDTDMSHGLSEEQRGQILRRTPLSRLGTVQDVVPLIAFLVSDQAGFITGQTVLVDGGLSC